MAGKKLVAIISDAASTGKIISYFKIVSIDGWMICNFMSFSTVFLSHQDDWRVIMKGCV